MKKVFLLILIASVIFSAFGCGSKDNTFSFTEFTITLPEEFYEAKKNEIYDLALTDGVAILGLNRISRVSAAEVGMPDWLSPSEFADYYMRKSEVDSELEYAGDVPYYVYYDTPVGGALQFCIVACYRSQYAYFTLFCHVDAEHEESYIGKFIDYIDNVTFKLI